VVTWFDPHGRRHRVLLPPTFAKADAQRLHVKRVDEAGRLPHGLRPNAAVTFRQFVEEPWRKEVALGLKPSTMRAYGTALRHHLLPECGKMPLRTITRAAVKAFIARKAKQQRWSYSRRPPNPNRPTLARESVLNMVAVLRSIMESAASDYELLPVNPLRGILRRRRYPRDGFDIREARLHVLEPEEFRAALAELPARPLRAVLFAALTGLRRGEQAAPRKPEDVYLTRNRLRITCALYKRVPQTPKEGRSVRDVDLSPIVRRILQAVPWEEGYVFSSDGQRTIGDGSWLKRQRRRG
jgi:integrase